MPNNRNRKMVLRATSRQMALADGAEPRARDCADPRVFNNSTAAPKNSEDSDGSGGLPSAALPMRLRRTAIKRGGGAGPGGGRAGPPPLYKTNSLSHGECITAGRQRRVPAPTPSPWILVFALVQSRSISPILVRSFSDSLIH